MTIDYKYSIGSRIQCYVKKGERIRWDKPWAQSYDTYGVGLRDFLVIGYPHKPYDPKVGMEDAKVGPGYLILVDDSDLIPTSWNITEENIKEGKVDPKYRGKPAYVVYEVAIVGRAKSQCDDCDYYETLIKKKYPHNLKIKQLANMQDG